MGQLNTIFRLTRVIVFGATSSFSLIVVVLGGLITNFTVTFYNAFFSFAALGLATGLLTLLTLPTMLALSILRKGVFTSMIAVEIGWISVLWILWLAVGGDSTSASSIVFVLGGCSRYTLFGSKVVAVCNEFHAITAFGFLSWLFLMFYNVFLVTLTVRQHLRGNTCVWTKDVIETDFSAVYENKLSPTYPNQYPPAGSPIVQQTTGSYTQQAAGPNQVVNPYPQPQAPSLYSQPQAQAATGSFTQTATSPYPQV